ncbi:MAG: hypothetical protein JRN20_06565 [Nitrososphaerota archaeon]|nr:hypothetical protein [Nitrososphaerota archaeon]
MTAESGKDSPALFVIPREDFKSLVHQQREAIESLVKEDEEKISRLEEEISDAKFDLTVHRSLLKLLVAKGKEEGN